MVASPVPSSEDRSFSSSCYQHFQCMIAFFVTKTNSWLTVNIVYKRIPPPMSLTAKLPSSQSALSMYRYMGLFLPKCRTFELVFTALKLSSLLRTHWMAALFHLPFPRKKHIKARLTGLQLPRVLLSDLPENRSNTCFPPVLRLLFQSPSSTKD